MTTQMVNFKWAQGEDLSINLVYKEGTTSAKALVVPLSSGYSLRMDLVAPTTKQLVYSFASDSVPGTLTSGANRTPNINITLPRTLTLPGGAVYEKITAAPPVSNFNYDIFLRNITSNKQVKILRGSINVEGSYTLWQ